MMDEILRTWPSLDRGEDVPAVLGLTARKVARHAEAASPRYRLRRERR